MRRPFLFKRSNGFWYVGYSNYENTKSGKSYKRVEIRKAASTGTKIKSEANQYLLDFQISKGYRKGIKPVLMSEFKKLFFESGVSNKSTGTRKNYSAVFDSFSNYIGDKLLQDYDIYELDKYLDHKKSEWSPHTAHLHRRCLKVIFDKAVQWKHLDTNLVPSTTKIVLPESDPLFFTKVEFKKLLEVTDDELYKDLFTLAVLTGLRLGEIINLKSEQIDTKKMLIQVLSSSEHTTKTNMTRHVELNKQLIPIVKKYSNQKYLFVGNRDNNKLNKVWVGKVTKAYVKKAKINPKLNFKAFRSTFGMWLLDENVNIKYVSQLLGHSSVSTTERHYAKYITTEPKGWINKIQID